VQGEAVVELVQLGGGLLQLGPVLFVVVVLEGDDGVEAVVAAVELDDDQDVAGVALGRLGGQQVGGVGQEGGHGGAAG